jgi:hypothetical protein
VLYKFVNVKCWGRVVIYIHEHINVDGMKFAICREGEIGGGTTALLVLRGFFPACSSRSCVVTFVYFCANPPSYVNWKNGLCFTGSYSDSFCVLRGKVKLASLVM